MTTPRQLFPILLVILLSGCHNLQEQETPPPDIDIPVQEVTAVEQWLLQRTELCNLPEIERRAQLTFLSKDPINEDALMKRLILAGCNPDQTPGLLAQALEAIPQTTEYSPAMAALLEMNRDFVKSYKILESNNQQLNERLKVTIDGIQQIEAEIDGLQSNGDTQ